MELKQLRYGEYSAVINVSRGANCISLRHAQYDAQILREPIYGEGGSLDNPYLYGMPILFPVNRISGGSFVFEGRTYRFPVNEPATGCHLHGTLHETAFTVLEEREDRIVCTYRATDAAPYHDFMHAFEIRTEYALGPDGLTHRVEVINHSDLRMPCMLGFHTTFNARFAGEGAVRTFADIAVEYERNMQNYLPTGRVLAFDAVSNALAAGSFSPFAQPISRHYRAGGNTVTLRNTDRRLKVVYECDPKLAFRLIYNGQADGYICLEPQNCLANAANAPFDRTESGFDFIEPHQSKMYSCKIYIIKE